MNRAVANITGTMSKLHISQVLSSAGYFGYSKLPTTSLKTAHSSPVSYSHISQKRLLELLENRPIVANTSLYLPPSVIAPKNYTFPTLKKVGLYAPTVNVKELVEVCDPVVEKAVDEPINEFVTPMYAGDRVLTIRRSKMNKHKRRKREKRDRFQLMKYHREQKRKSEQLFREQMKMKLADLQAFNAEAYVRDVITRAKRDWKAELAPSGRKKYPHWSSLMSLEELYDLPAGDYIHKAAGLPSEEDKERIRNLKIKYYKEFKGKNIDKDKDNEVNES